MPDRPPIVYTATLAGVGALAHAVWTWPQAAILTFFAVGTLTATIGEAIVIHRGWLEHHLTPKLVGVPLYAIGGWLATMYIIFRLTLLVVSGWQAVLGTAVVATAYDVLTDHYGVEQGFWTYTDTLPGPRYRGVPWWNYLGWFTIASITTAATVPML